MKGRRPFSPSADGENPLFSALFFLPSFFFCASFAKRKSGIKVFAQINQSCVFGLQPAGAKSSSPLFFLKKFLKKQKKIKKGVDFFQKVCYNKGHSQGSIAQLVRAHGSHP